MTKKICSAVVAALASTASVVSAGAQTVPLPQEPTVVMSGEGVVQAVPDRAWVTITAESRAGSPRDAQRRNVEAMTPVQARLRSAGLAGDAIRTIGYDLQQEWDFVNGKRVSRGYLARNIVEVRIDQIDRVGELLELAVGSGATSLGGIRFDLKERVKLEREALRLAVADARAKADAAAAGAGRTIDRILRIDEQRTAGARPFMMEGVAARMAADAAPPISAGQLEIRADVTVTAILK